MKSNVAVRSNLMLDDEEHKPHYRYIPGDFVGEIYHEFPNLRDIGTAERELTEQQLIERRQYLVCSRCFRKCAGTCER